MMGGFGSGKWGDAVTRKATTGLCRSISAKRLKDAGVFDGKAVSITWVNDLGDEAGTCVITPRLDGHGNTSHLRLKFGGSVTVTASDIPITSTACHYGGVRYWFLCPAVKDGLLCENRVGVLYLPPGGSVFACRHCWDLTYDSCQKSHKYDRVLEHIEGMDTAALSVNQVLRLASL